MSQVTPLYSQRILKRFFCTFIPYLVPKSKGATAPAYWDTYPTSHFVAIEPASKVLLDEIVLLAKARTTAILDMGCNVGRHLNYLFNQGYQNLRGVDFSRQAIQDMAARYPEMYQASKLYVASFQSYLSSNPGPFDLVYTHGATFELVHPSFPLIHKVCQITRRYVVLVISETGHSYPRFWEYEFAREGFELTHLRRPDSELAPELKMSLMTFKRL